MQALTATCAKVAVRRDKSVTEAHLDIVEDELDVALLEAHKVVVEVQVLLPGCKRCVRLSRPRGRREGGCSASAAAWRPHLPHLLNAGKPATIFASKVLLELGLGAVLHLEEEVRLVGKCGFETKRREEGGR